MTTETPRRSVRDILTRIMEIAGLNYGSKNWKYEYRLRTIHGMIAEALAAIDAAAPAPVESPWVRVTTGEPIPDVRDGWYLQRLNVPAYRGHYPAHYRYRSVEVVGNEHHIGLSPKVAITHFRRIVDPPASPVDGAAAKGYVPCGCDHHGDHAACDANCECGGLSR